MTTVCGQNTPNTHTPGRYLHERGYKIDLLRQEQPQCFRKHKFAARQKQYIITLETWH